MSTTDIGAVLQMAIGVTFALSTVQKLRRPVSFIHGIRQYRLLPENLLAPFGALVIVLEAVIAIAHLTGLLVVYGRALGFLLLSTFLVAVASVMMRNIPVTCHCFGSAEGEWVSARTVIRLLLLLGAEAYVLLMGMFHAAWTAPRDHGLVESLQAAMAASLLLAVTSWVLAAPDVKAMIRLCLTCGLKNRNASNGFST
jgi:Methylamine utilisation protein MauE